MNETPSDADATPRGPTPARRVRRVYLTFVLGVIVGCLLFLPVVLWGPSSAPSAVADVRLPLRSEGVIVPFTLGQPGKVRIHVSLPAMLSTDVRIGPLYVAMRPDEILEPERDEDRVRTIEGCETAAFVESFEKAGVYAVRVPSIPTAMGMESEMFVTVRVERVGD